MSLRLRVRVLPRFRLFRPSIRIAPGVTIGVSGGGAMARFAGLLGAVALVYFLLR